MARPSKKDIKAALDKLKEPADGKPEIPDRSIPGSLAPKKSSQRIRKQGV